ncbi:hypothetical protein TcCL_ESM00382 [Trypanosoma cruzi]|nr:hypothetical protein TcCL_ESM00382 [Trypanosoma cruzi]
MQDPPCKSINKLRSTIVQVHKKVTCEIKPSHIHAFILARLQQKIASIKILQPVFFLESLHLRLEARILLLECLVVCRGSATKHLLDEIHRVLRLLRLFVEVHKNTSQGVNHLLSLEVLAKLLLLRFTGLIRHVL